jgi:serine/threonine protein kinase
VHPQCGTRGYIAPEVLAQTSTTTKCDVYSLGVILGQWLEVYFPDSGLAELGSCLLDSFTMPYIFVDPKAPAIIHHALDLLQRMLTHNVDIRISCAQILEHPFITSSKSCFEGYEYSKWHSLLRRTRHSKSEPIIFYRC